MKSIEKIKARLEDAIEEYNIAAQKCLNAYEKRENDPTGYINASQILGAASAEVYTLKWVLEENT